MTESNQVPAEEVDLGLDEDGSPADVERVPQPDHIVSPDDPDDPARAPETLGIDNTDTALGAEDDSAPVE
jgi:hypothetical protein